MSKLLSIIIPSYNESESIHYAVHELDKVLSDIVCEYIFVDDGSKDDTYNQIQKARENNERVKGIKLSRNFGKESAISAGLFVAKGDCCVVIDCDMQHPPDKIVEMYDLWCKGYKIVEGIKEDRGTEGWIHKKFANLFYRLMSETMGIDMRNSSDFKLIDREVIDVIKNLPEKSMFFRGLTYWVGFDTASVSYRVNDRNFGKTKWSKLSLWKYAIKNITSFSSAPMQIVTFIGGITLLLSGVLGINTLYNYFSGEALEGFSTVILVILFMGSLIMVSLGIIGYYIAKIYEEIKGRPSFIIEELKE